MMWTLAAILLALAVTGCLGQDYELVWEDNFDGDSIDFSKWDHEITAWGGGNSEFQVYTDDPWNSYVRDGLLFIMPTLLEENINPLTGQPFGPEFMQSGTLDLVEMYGRCTNSDNGGCYRTGYDYNGDIPPTMSARLRSHQRFWFRGGRAEILAKVPVGDWLWPALWLLPEFWVYGEWPLSGEMDMTESIGNPDFVSPGGEWYGIQKMGSTLHWGVSWDQNRWYLTNAHYFNEGQDFGNHFHLYAMEWDENGFIFSVDGVEVARYPDPLINENPDWVDWYTFGSPWNPGSSNPWEGASNMAPFDHDFHFILNVAVGGTNGFIPDDGINRGGDPAYQKPWSNSDWYLDAMRKFYDTKDGWLWTWAETEGENAAMQIDYVRVYQRV